MGSKFVDNQINHVIDILNVIFTGILITWWGRKKAIFYAVIISDGLTLIVFAFSFVNNILLGIALLITRIFWVCAFTANKIFCIELFPTRVRASGTGLVFWATAIGILASFYLSLIDYQI